MSELREQIIMKQALPLHKKSDHSANGAKDTTAPTARNMIARGKREARRPWY